MGSPSTVTCFSRRCQPRGRTSSVAISSFRLYCFSPVSSEIVRSTASMRFDWPSTQFVHVGEFASSKSAMKTFAPELSALITILRSTGPVISTRRSWRSAGVGATRQLRSSRTSCVSGRKSGSSPASIRCCRSSRRWSSSARRGPSSRCSVATKARASGVRMRSPASPASASTSTPAGSVVAIGID